MKSIFLILLWAFAHTINAHAEDIKLLDGRKYAEAKIVSQSARRVVISYPNGIISVSKELLPEDLRKEYPVDLNLAAIEQKTSEEARKAALAESETLKRRTADQALRVQRQLQVDEDQKRRIDQQRSKAISFGRTLVGAYFKDSRGHLLGASSTYSVSVDEARMLDGDLAKWELSGSVTVRNVRDFSQTGSSQERAKYFADDKKLSARELRARRAEMEYINTECFRYSAKIEDLDGDPRVSVWTK